MRLSGALRSEARVVAFWVLGSAIVAGAQPGLDRRATGAAAALAGMVTILVVSRLTADPGLRHVRSILGAIVAVAVTTNWLFHGLGVAGPSSFFGVGGLAERIVLPLLVVLLAPLAARRLPRDLWARRNDLWRTAPRMDAIIAAYATVVAFPALLVGLAHHDRLLFVGQDVGLIVFFVFMYGVGRTVDAAAARAAATDVVGVLLMLAVAQVVLFGWQPYPLYVYVEGAAAGAIAFAILRPRTASLLAVAAALVFLAADAASLPNASTGSSLTFQLAGAIAAIGYLVVRIRPLVPQRLIVAVAVIGFIGFIGVTPDGATVRGQYHGSDPSNLGRTFEAHQIRAAVRSSPVSLVFGRGLGASIDERNAPAGFAQSLTTGGRDLAHVPEVHLLPYSFLLKEGVLGLAWLATLLLGAVVLIFRGLERAARDRDPRLVIYAALPLIGIAQAFAAANHLQANPLNALGLGILVTCLARPRAATPPTQVS
jgi:hypothetical protein